MGVATRTVRKRGRRGVLAVGEDCGLEEEGDGGGAFVGRVVVALEAVEEAGLEGEGLDIVCLLRYGFRGREIWL